jgi:hypothetical protein
MEADASLQTTAASAAPANRGTNSQWLQRLIEQKRQRTTTFKIINVRRYLSAETAVAVLFGIELPPSG